MSGTPDAQLIATPEYRQRIAQCILDGVNRYKQAVTNQPAKTVGGGCRHRSDQRAEPRSRAVGAQTGMESSVAQAQDALKSSASGN